MCPQLHRTLTVASLNPSSGVSVTVSPNDNSGQGSGATQFTRVYNNNTNVSLTAPATAAGNNFQKWQRDGVDFTTSLLANFVMDANHTMTAVYSRKAQFDFDADRNADISIFRPTDNTWWILKSTDGTQRVRQWGATGDTLVPGDYDGDGTADIAVFRPSNGTWWVFEEFRWRHHSSAIRGSGRCTCARRLRWRWQDGLCYFPILKQHLVDSEEQRWNTDSPAMGGYRRQAGAC